MNSQPKVDQRILRTRQTLREALMALVVEQPYETITVQQIAVRAGVARTTFYLHYRDRDDLLFRGFSDLYDQLRTAVAPLQMNATADWEHVAAHADFYRALLGKQGHAAFIVFLRNLLVEVMQEHVIRPLVGAAHPRLNVDLIAHSLAGAQLGLYIWWLESDMAVPAVEMAQAGQDMAVKGLLWATGVAGSSVEMPAGES
jgi:AcrR family transcriptional regulator